MATSSGAYKAISIDVANSFRRAVEQGLVGVNRQLEAFVRGMDVGAKGDMTRVHRAIASDVRESVQGAYLAKVDAVRRVEPYPRYQRRSGYLERVLSRQDFARGDDLGVHFVNEDVLDKEAAHWRRLNFGAGEAAGGQPAPYPIRVFGETVALASFGYGPSPGFVLPRGFFVHGGRAEIPNSAYRGGGSVAPFYPNRRSPVPPSPTVGIRGRHFLEAGLETVAEQIPIRYADLLNEWILRGGRKARAVHSVTG